MCATSDRSWIAGLWLFAAAVFLFPQSRAAGSAPVPFSHRAWQFQKRDAGWILARIADASGLGINAVQLSHDIVMNASDLGTASTRVMVNQAAAQCKSLGIECYVWVHEFDAVPGAYLKNGKLDFDNPALWTYLRNRYQDVFRTQSPELTGIVLTFHETDYIVFDDGKVVSALSPEQRTAKLIRELYRVCRSSNKKFIVRDFAYTPAQLDFIQQAFALAADSLGRHDLIVMSKQVPHDWQPFYPFNPLIGNVSGFDQIVESDCGSEFYGQGFVPYDQVDYLQSGLEYGRTHGIIGSVTRIERMSYPAWGTLNEMCVAAFSKMAQDLQSDPDALRLEWIQSKFGNHAGTAAIRSALKRTFGIVNTALFPKGEWITNHSMVPGYSYAIGHIRENSRYKWTGSPVDYRTQQELLHPTEQTLLDVRQEKENALKGCDSCLADIESAKPFLKSEDYTALNYRFRLLKDMVKAFRVHNDVLFRYNRYADTGSGLSEIRLGIGLIRQQAQTIETLYGKTCYTPTDKSIVDELRKFADEMSAKIPAAGIRLSEEGASIPSQWALEQNFPNPFNGSTEFRLRLSVPGQVRLTILDMQGQTVQALVNAGMPAGMHRFRWDGKNGKGMAMPTGLYIGMMHVDGMEKKIKLTLFR